MSMYVFGGYNHGQGINIGFTDGHAKLLILGPLGSSYYPDDSSANGSPPPQNDRRTQPYRDYGAYGFADYPNYDDYSCHPFMFRPDCNFQTP